MRDPAARNGQSNHPEASLPAAPSILAPPLVDAHEVVGALSRRRWLVIGTTVVGGLLGAVMVMRTPPSYEALATIRVSDVRRELAGTLVDPALRMEGSVVDPVQSEVELLESRAVATRALAGADGGVLRVRTVDIPFDVLTGLAVAPDAQPDTVHLHASASGVVVVARAGRDSAAAGERVELGGVSFAVPDTWQGEGQLIVLPEADAIQAIRSRLEAVRRESTNLVDVYFRADDPLLAQRAVNQMVTAFTEVSAEAARDRSRARRVFLEQRLVETQGGLARARDSLTSLRTDGRGYVTRDRYLGDQADVAATLTERRRMSEELLATEQLLAQLDAAGARAEDARVRSALVAFPSSSNALISRLADDLLGLELSRDSLTAGPRGLSATNPAVVRADTLIGLMRQRLRDAARRHATALAQREGQLGERAEQQGARLAMLPRLEAEEVRLTSELEGFSRLTQQLKEEYQRALIAEAAERGEIEVVDLATVPDPRDGGTPLRWLFFGLSLGLLGGSTAAIAAEQYNSSIRRREEVEELLGGPALGIIPNAVASRLALPPFGRNKRVTEWLCAEAFGSLRTNLLFAHQEESPRTFTVTSPLQGEGKSTVLANLGTAFARQGFRVIMVDCDLRRPSLHRALGVTRQPGLTEVLGGMNTVEDAIRVTAVPNLALMPAGAHPDYPAELLGGEPMQRLLQTLADQFDVVLVDTPPALLTTDASVLAALTEGTILVLCAGRTKRDEARNALQQLERVGANVLGFVLNDPDQQAIGSDRDYYYRAARTYGRIAEGTGTPT